MTTGYLHGYDTAEQTRLVRQAAYWRDTLLLPGLGYRPGERVLEVGCAAGAALAEIAAAFPGVRVAGLDLEERQIAFAREHLAARGVEGADLRVGDACALPWADASFDHVFMMWFLEHLPDADTRVAALREALRVLRPGGTITATETDYEAFGFAPSFPDVELLLRAQRDWFGERGSAVMGRELGPLLVRAGFADVRNPGLCFHFFRGDGTERLRAHTEYVVGFLAPAVAPMAAAGGLDLARLERGLALLAALPDVEGAAATQVVHRGRGTKR